MHGAAGKNLNAYKGWISSVIKNPTEHTTEYGVRIPIYYSKIFLKMLIALF